MKYYIVILMLFFQVGMISCSSSGNHQGEDAEQVSKEKEDTDIAKEHNGDNHEYFELGYVRCGYYNYEIDDFDWYEDATLYVKKYQDTEYYYIALKGYERKYPVEKGFYCVKNSSC